LRCSIKKYEERRRRRLEGKGQLLPGYFPTSEAPLTQGGGRLVFYL
jgi:hypothetical protein